MRVIAKVLQGNSKLTSDVPKLSSGDIWGATTGVVMGV